MALKIIFSLNPETENQVIEKETAPNQRIGDWINLNL